MPSRCQHRLVAFLISLLFCCLPAHAQAGAWRMVARHPEAAAASTTWGARWLWALQPWHGRLFVGYGSYNGANPAAVIRAFDPGAGRFADAPAFTTNNEALGLFRDLGGRLYVPAMDAHDSGASAQVFALTTDERGDMWLDRAAQLPMYHVWDMATLTGTDVWYVGAAPSITCPFDFCSDAVAYRSTDGVNFVEAIRLPTADAGYRLGWFNFAAVFNGKLYLQPFFRFAPTGLPDIAPTQSLVFDGHEWNTGPDLLPRRSLGESGYGPAVVGRWLVYLTRSPIARSYPNALPLWQNTMDIVLLDTAEHVRYLNIPGGVANFTVADGVLYVLTRTGAIRRTADPTRAWKFWEALPDFPARDPDPQQGNAGRSIARLDGALFVGTTQAELWQLDLTPTKLNAPPVRQQRGIKP